MPDIDLVWGRIMAHQGEEFHQIRGQSFTYQVSGSSVHPSTTKQNLAKGQFAEALELVPLSSTVPLQHLRGPSYLFAILMDKRIRQADW